ncbi:hypothetical protein L218DRAFT_961661 [Marasmius fiardii PR-910]|nr:hypothetical protein L218DRAFT_961661 [Marasmius fiardii PR-910]
MHFKSSILAGTFSALAFAFVSNAIPITQRDVYVPRITSPNASTVWTAGSKVNVTWDTSDAPAQIGNRASVELHKASPFANLGKLVQDFDLRAGFVEVTVPNVQPASDYSITLFGDSGNISPLFSIVVPEAETETKSKRDVWSPRITSPVAGTVWVIGTTVNVTWDTSDQPTLISNGAAVLLNKDGYGQQYLKDFETFELTAGSIEVVVPDVEPGSDYSITLFGDSGNQSEQLTIARPNEA